MNQDVEIITDADLVNTYAAMMMAEPAKQVVTQAPPPSDVTLLVGTPGGATNAVIRELNGADEEAIAKASSAGRALETILQRGVVSIGDKPVSEMDLASLTSGDRELLLLAIRKITFGKDLELRLRCSDCGDVRDYKLSLEDDVPVAPFKGVQSWNVETKLGVLQLGLPNGITQRKLLEASDKTAAELSTIFLGGCIQALNGAPVVGQTVALSLSILDRETVLRSVLDTTPGPRLSEVSKACEACGADIRVPLSLAELFRLWG